MGFLSPDKSCSPRRKPAKFQILETLAVSTPLQQCLKGRIKFSLFKRKELCFRFLNPISYPRFLFASTLLHL